MIAVNMGTGAILPVQLIFQGKTAAVEPAIPLDAVGKVLTAHSETHWATLETTKQFVEMISRERDAIVAANGLSHTTRCLLVWDVFYTHREASVLELCRKKNVVVLFVNANCTGFLQVCDVSLNKPWKSEIERAYMAYLVDYFEGAEDDQDDVAAAGLKAKLAIGALRNATVGFTLRAIQHIDASSAVINGVRRIGLHEIHSPEWKVIYQKLESEGLFFLCLK
jgi:hypothetical protein